MSRRDALADKIARRDTELQRAYDRMVARRQKLWQQVEAARVEIIRLDNSIIECEKRAAEQGYPNIL